MKEKKIKTPEELEAQKAEKAAKAKAKRAELMKKKREDEEFANMRRQVIENIIEDKYNELGPSRYIDEFCIPLLTHKHTPQVAPSDSLSTTNGVDNNTDCSNANVVDNNTDCSNANVVDDDTDCSNAIVVDDDTDCSNAHVLKSVCIHRISVYTRKTSD